MREIKNISEKIRMLDDPVTLLENLFTYSPAAFQIYKADGHCLFFNQAFRDLFGSSPPPDYNILHDEIMERYGMLDRIQRAFNGETTHIPAHWYDPRELKQVTVTKGRPVGIEITLFPLKDRAGAIRHVALCFKDVTAELELKQAERKLRENEMHLLASQHIAKVGSWELDLTVLDDLDINPLRWSDECYRVFGFEPGEVTVTNDIFWSRVHPDDRPAIETAVSQALQQGKTYSIEHRIVLPDGGERIIHERADIICDPDTGRMLKMIGTSQDITSRKQAEQTLREVNEQLQLRVQDLARSNMELQQFAYIASHDLQTPLRSISGFLQLLADNYRDKLDVQGEEWITRSVAGARRMQQLIRDLLEYSRVDARAQPFQPVEMREVFHDALEILESSIRECGGRIICDELPTVLGDKALLVQLLQNLLGNAIKYRSSKPLRVQVLAARADGKWRFAVRDNGIGIDPKQHSRIFEIFRRLHTQEAYPGTGIGLAIAQRIVHFHGGDIWVESQLNEGSTFYFTIPEKIKS
jgi:PAS domain S-box-containing protein